MYHFYILRQASLHLQSVLLNNKYLQVQRWPSEVTAETLEGVVPLHSQIDSGPARVAGSEADQWNN